MISCSTIKKVLASILVNTRDAGTQSWQYVNIQSILVCKSIVKPINCQYNIIAQLLRSSNILSIHKQSLLFFICLSDCFYLLVVSFNAGKSKIPRSLFCMCIENGQKRLVRTQNYSLQSINYSIIHFVSLSVTKETKLYSSFN